ncbi:serine/threonine-protein kinase [Nonomuraea gerenzanensis]|uniref:Serine/threonine protein kinase n=1 Tax=Nonomuraea gerenzanensis TaxID=93944 RepID=A0A1M4E3H8_9ACTN|nr:serine/threonine-protein kinase [Nonomuraea gerenzanensis]UBU15626.1 protein kinase [Nonomuraea gerenzanensis]SBO93395.1 serine/threonine protein kinase [Nonomuraea gerenzanensis]
MPEITELRAGDPTEVAEYRLTGRLTAQVFTGRSRSGEPVLVRLLPPEMEPEPFLRAMEPLRGVSAVGTAQILGAGVFGEQAYLVTEFVDGPALKDVGGTFDGVGLYRLAAGTITALVAIHQAGLAHGDIRPGNVLLGPDGPRVIDAGLEQAMAAASVSTRKVAVPAYTAPERLRGGEAGAAADVFSWAATMVFAVSGASPFEGGSMSATVDRIVNQPPDLPDLGELHGLIARCLDKDPAARPAASDVLLRLVGQTSLLSGQVSHGPSPPETAPPARRSLNVAALAAAFAAGALLSGAGVYALTGDRAATVTRAAATPAASGSPATPTVAVSQTAAPEEKVEKKAATDLEVKDIDAVLHEHPSDSMRLTSFLGASGQFTSYVREKGGAFRTVGRFEQPLLSPGGDWVALNPLLKYQGTDLDQVKFTKLSTGESFVVSTVKKPLSTSRPFWSRDGGKLLLSVYDMENEPARIVGFVVVDVAARKAVHVETEYADDATLAYNFAPDGTVVRGFWDGENKGIEFYDLSGQVTKTMHWVGHPKGGEWFSPSGKRLATVCPSGKDYCVWDLQSGARQATVPFSTGEGSFLGWFNEKHLLVQDPGKKKGTAQIKIIDLTGDTSRVLVDLATDKPHMLQFARVPAS